MWTLFFPLSIDYPLRGKDLLSLSRDDISFTGKSMFSSCTHFDLFSLSLHVIMDIRGKMSQ